MPSPHPYTPSVHHNTGHRPNNRHKELRDSGNTAPARPHAVSNASQALTLKSKAPLRRQKRNAEHFISRKPSWCILPYPCNASTPLQCAPCRACFLHAMLSMQHVLPAVMKPVRHYEDSYDHTQRSMWQAMVARLPCLHFRGVPPLPRLPAAPLDARCRRTIAQAPNN